MLELLRIYNNKLLLLSSAKSIWLKIARELAHFECYLLKIPRPVIWRVLGRRILIDDNLAPSDVETHCKFQLFFKNL